MKRDLAIPVVVLTALLGSTGMFAVLDAAPAGSLAASVGDAQAITPEELGRLLFWDPILSGPMDVACATCHHPDFAYADGRALSLGIGAVGLGPDRRFVAGGDESLAARNSQTVLNTAFNGVSGTRGASVVNAGVLQDAARDYEVVRAPMFWDNRTSGLELQALEPLKVREEMRGDAFPEEVAVDSIVARLRAIPEYVELFAGAFGGDADITAERLAEAMAAFQRSLVAVNSPFDRYQAGERDAMTPEQVRGMWAFDAASCNFCHNGPLLSDFRLHAEGVPEHPLVPTPDEGAGYFRFRTPSLRNVALTSPYMHNGTIETLEDVLRFYDRRSSENPHVSDQPRRPTDIVSGAPSASLDWDLRFLNDFTEADIRDMLAFFDALTDTEFDRTVPDRVPSGLPPGGSLQAP
ncbi:MAG: cytochrome c peroxidase [Gemmatimonadota bacterium]